MSSVDVAIPCYQYGRFLRECVASVLTQDLEDVRILIIDNASTDDSLEVAQQLARDDPRVEILAHRVNLGPHASYNAGIDWAAADYFLVLDADDLLAPGCLARAISVMEQHPDVSFTHGVEVRCLPGEPTWSIEPSHGEATWRISTGTQFIERLCRRPVNIVGSPTVVRRTTAQKLVGHYRPELPYTDDLEMWLRLASVGRVAETDAVQAIRRVHGLQVSAHYRSVHQVRDFKEREAAFESFFSNEGRSMAQAEQLLESVRRGLGEHAYWSALSHALRGYVQAGTELLDFSRERRPRSGLLPPLGWLLRMDRPVSRIVAVGAEALGWTGQASGRRNTPAPDGADGVVSGRTSVKRIARTMSNAMALRVRTRARTPPRRIGLFGLFGCGNSGNDGSLEAMLRFLREVRPDAELVCICADPELVQRIHEVPTLPIDSFYAGHGRSGSLTTLLFKIPRKLLDLVHTIRRMRDIDVLIIPGTGILDDFGERPWGMPYALLKWCSAARLFGAKLAFVSIGAGPINHPVSRRLMKSAARLAHYRSYRDTISKEYMASIGCDVSKDPVYPDIAFKLPLPHAPGARDLEEECLTVGVGVMSYGGWYNFAEAGATIYTAYIEKITRFVLWLLDRGDRVRILTGETSDRSAVDDVLKAVLTARPNVPAQRIIAEPSTSLHDLMRQIADTDVVVATRFHNVVCALKLGLPTVSLSYAKKNDVLLEDMGLGAFCQHVETFDVDLLIDQFSRLVPHRKSHEQRIQAVNLAYSERLGRQDRFLIANFL